MTKKSTARKKRAPQADAGAVGKRRTIRLSERIRPERVELHFELDPKQRGFRGEARYLLELDRNTRQIELHAAELNVSAVSALSKVTPETDSNLDSPHEEQRGIVEPHPECETILLRFDRPLRQGHIELRLRFRGRVRDDLRGLYRSSDRQQPWLASQLCPTDARRFFPCFDEPGIKACYAISVTAPSTETVISNAPVRRQTRASRTHTRTDFRQTPPLSAYLVAVAVGPFVASRPAKSGDTPIRIYTLPGRERLGRFARRAAVESLDRLERWFGMPHPYEKLDLVALPDFAFGAMENAGAVFFRDSVLLLDEKASSAADRMRTAETVAHELAHMWFGNLVTMAWWNDLWLNESFATWMAYEIVDDWQPDWRMWHEFIHRRESALEMDALKTSHPIAPPVRTADEAHENFDAITYTKGASVLRMLERYLSPRIFRDGVRRYIRAHRESAATAGDLWRALSEASGLPIERIVSPWTLRVGYPVIQATRAQRSGARTPLRLRQSRFLSIASRQGNARQKREDSAPWTVPWIGRVGQGKKSDLVRQVMEHRTLRVPQAKTAAKGTEWLYANADESGFFRIDHGQSGFDALLENTGSLSSLEQVGWVGHQWALVRAKQAPIKTTLDLTATLAAEPPDPNVLFALERVLTRIQRRLAPSQGPEVETQLKAWIACLFRPALMELGLRNRSGEDAMTRRSRAHLISLVGEAGNDSELGQRCYAWTCTHLERGKALPAESADAIVRIAASFAAKSKRHERFLQPVLLKNSAAGETPQARRRYLIALAGFGHGPALRKTLRATLDQRLAPAVDRATLLMHLLSSPITASPTWLHLESSWPALEKALPPILLARIAAESAHALPRSQAPRVRAFFKAHPLAAGDRVTRQLNEEWRLASQLERSAGKALAEYLATQPPPPP